MSIILPQIEFIKLHGFKPTFSKDITFNLKTGFNIILGGNGLGKTTILQATIYALTGGITDKIEEDKYKRWNHNYFKGRIADSDIGNATIEASVCFGKNQLKIKRGFMNSKVLCLETNVSQETIADPESQYIALLQSLGGYETLEDFSFVVHKLLYMPESRDLLAWDLDAQLRLLMSFCKDVIDETAFRKMRNELQFCDTQKRHTHVRIGKLEKEIEYLQKEASNRRDILSTVTRRPQVKAFEEVSTALVKATKERRAIDAKLVDARMQLTTNTNDLEQLQDAIGNVEAVFIEKSINAHENGEHLALSKLVESSICPACGSKSTKLQELAKSNLKSCGCILCGTETQNKKSADLSTFYSQLVEKNRAQMHLQKTVQVLTLALEQRQEVEYKLREKFDAIRSQNEASGIVTRTSELGSVKYKLDELAKLKITHATLEAKANELSNLLERKYVQFLSSIGVRKKALQDLYSQYASSFLGMECHLIQQPADDPFVPLELFIPSFKGQPRPNPESCSEAQRFFLDIAFRMAMIDLASSLSKTPASFCCETPETALDLSYEDNVVEMFNAFAKRGHILLLTANIQRNGLAKGMLDKVQKKEREARVLNLLGYGQLSDVQKKAKSDLDKAVAAILG